MKVSLAWEKSEAGGLLEEWLASHQGDLSCVLEELYRENFPESSGWDELEISLQFLDEEAMAALNGQYRGENRPTDVLSFPLWENDGHLELPPAGGVLPLGDLVFCRPVLDANAAAAGTSVQSELALLLAHGALHLIAWDHDTEERRAAMWAVQERYRQRILERAGACVKEG
ncbi:MULTISPECIES: rRNA maturation RNase YbeY [Jonquetella]|uniref:Endoribonuclease YbeY n=1 Tax=Jonquetella anthropi DSM 22815 TaxID=885272 RepID=H0UIJ1_9BACT|nr:MULTISPECIES: rRNA maturation RNase YbeY [Jonquetella]EHM12699.1 metalloprotein, YbeY/UPF0054 family [Jonquetella anthropi DSM 22815]ERL24739.1 putative rRNA maturation factor YbeY [Jonquetella sp. BV3C21]